MKRFTELYFEIDATNRTGEKVEAMARYFREAPPEDAAWALYFLSGRKLNRLVATNALRQWLAEETGLPMWLIEECYDTVGDLGETLALLYPDRERREDIPLHRLVAERMTPLRTLSDPEKREILVHDWNRMSMRERLVWNKLITGSFRVGVARTLLERAIAHAADLPQPLIAHRLMGDWEPSAAGYAALIAPAEAEAIHHAQPYPFFLAQPLENAAQPLGEVQDWLAEWKWDGIRAQLLRRNGETRIWTRGEELVTDRFPEVAAIGPLLPDGTVIDGEILAWDAALAQPLPFAALQRRIGRKTVGPKLLKEVPVALVAFDLLEWECADLRETPLQERRALLQQLVTTTDAPALRLSPPLPASTWNELAVLRAQCREANAEGLMLKRKSSAYGVGRPRGDWWKWKIEPYSLDAVLTAAQSGHGNRANLFTDYTFGVWHEGRLVTIAKAYSGLTNAEIAAVDAFVRRHTLERHGPVRVVEPLLVFELAFEGVQTSTRHKSGLAVRFPRIVRQRKDKQPIDADTLETLRALATTADPESASGE